MTEKNYKEEHARHEELCKEHLSKAYDGIWQSEGNRHYFTAHGFKCLVLRHYSLGYLCGYVGLCKFHKLYNQSYEINPEYDLLEVHGGITYTEHDSDFISFPNEVYFWVGFDCGHSQDLLPKDNYKLLAESYKRSGLSVPTYKDVHYVTNECKELARQLREIQNKHVERLYPSKKS